MSRVIMRKECLRFTGGHKLLFDFPTWAVVLQLVDGHMSDILVLVGGGGKGASQSEKRLAKDLRRLRMVSAFTSSWLRLARGVGVSGMLKVLVRDWDLL